MKKAKRILLPLLLAIGLLCVLLWSLPTTLAKAYYGDLSYKYRITRYQADYVVHNDYTMQVTEHITIHFLGHESTGFYRDIPVNGGDTVRDLKVKEVVKDFAQGVDYNLSYEDDFIRADIGDYSNKTDEVHTYRITYTYCITKPASQTEMYLNVVGYGWNTEINEYQISFTTESGLQAASYVAGRQGNTHAIDVDVNDGRGVITGNNLTDYQGVTLTLKYDANALTAPKQSVIPYLLCGIAVVVLLATIAISVLKFEQPITPVVNVTAPDKMDPLRMGKLIDNTVDAEDITSLIYYWADKGYIKIDLTDEDDPVLLRIFQKLPDDAPAYQKIMYHDLFQRDDRVEISSLENVFYETVNKVVHTANAKEKSYYKGYRTSLICTLLATVVGMGIPFLYGMFTVNFKFYSPSVLFLLFPIVGIYILTTSGYYNRIKSHKKYAVMILASVGVALAGSLFFAFITPSPVFPFLAAMILGLISCATAIVAVSIVKRTDEYTQTLNDIVGFKNFILYAEKDRLEAMLQDDPEFFYHVLPYAQVLGVSHIWENKFKGLTVQPPRWCSYGGMDVFDYMILNSAIHRSTANMTRAMLSRPASSGKSGGSFGGGSFGGFGGGGHGGGGGGGR